MKARSALAVLLLLGGFLGNCRFQPYLGESPFYCNDQMPPTQPLCPNGYACVTSLNPPQCCALSNLKECVPPPAPDSGAVEQVVSIDASSCIYPPPSGRSKATASSLTVSTTQTNTTNWALCSGTDVNWFTFPTIPATVTSLQITLTPTPISASIQGVLTDSKGNMVATTMAESGGGPEINMAKVSTSGQPYYLEVSSPSKEAISSYSLGYIAQ